jgi:hypothetical protein
MLAFIHINRSSWSYMRNLIRSRHKDTSEIQYSSRWPTGRLHEEQGSRQIDGVAGVKRHGWWTTAVDTELLSSTATLACNESIERDVSSQDHYHAVGRFTALQWKLRLCPDTPMAPPPTALLARKKRFPLFKQVSLRKAEVSDWVSPWPSNSLRGSSDSGTTTVNNRRRTIARI